MDGHSRRWRRARRKFLFTTSLALFLFSLQNASARPCSESDVYPGYPIQKHDHKWGRPRPHPHLTGPRFDDPCSLLDLVNADLSADEALLLIRCIRYAENGEYRNLTIDQNLDGTKIDGVGISSVVQTPVAFTSDLPSGLRGPSKPQAWRMNRAGKLPGKSSPSLASGSGPLVL